MNIYNNAYILLLLTTCFWAGNAISGQLAKSEVSPFVIVFLRWVLVAGFFSVAYRKEIVAHRSDIKASVPRLTMMAIAGFTGFNALFYIAAHGTTALNIGILQGSIPVIVFAGALLMYKTPVTPLQIIGTIATIIGVIIVTSHGDLAKLLALKFNHGDAVMLLACLFYAVYTVMLRDKPALPNLVLFSVLAIIALVASIPLVAYEIWTGSVRWPTMKGWGVIIFIAVFPSCLSQIFFMRGVELLGPGRAGVFSNLVPVFTALFAVLLLSEQFQVYHALALMLVGGGIWITQIGQKT